MAPTGNTGLGSCKHIYINQSTRNLFYVCFYLTPDLILLIDKRWTPTAHNTTTSAERSSSNFPTHSLPGAGTRGSTVAGAAAHGEITREKEGKHEKWGKRWH